MTGQTIEHEATLEAPPVAQEAPPEGANLPEKANGHARRVAVERADAVGANLLSVLAKLTEKLDPSLDIDKLKSMLGVAKELMGERARLAFLRDRAMMREELPTVDANGVIMMKNSKTAARNFYAEQDSIVEACAPVMAKYGFTHDYSFWQDEKSGPDKVWVTVTLAHDEGHTQTSPPFPWPIMRVDSMNLAQQIATAVSYGVRYGFKAVVPYVSHAPLTKDEFERRKLLEQQNPPGRAIAKGDDTDGQASNRTSEAPGFERSAYITEAQRKVLIERLKAANVSPLKMNETFKIADPSKFPADKYDAFMKWLDERIAKVTGAQVVASPAQQHVETKADPGAMPAKRGMIPEDPHAAWEKKVMAFLERTDLDQVTLLAFNAEHCEPMEGVVPEDMWQRVTAAFGTVWARVMQKDRRVAQR